MLCIWLSTPTSMYSEIGSSGVCKAWLEIEIVLIVVVCVGIISIFGQTCKDKDNANSRLGLALFLSRRHWLP